MKNSHITKLSLLCASSLFLIGCDQDFSNPVGDTSSYSNGTADFSNYVSVGDSLTAGYADGALYRSGQINSFPNILATQFKTVGGGEFIQPLMDDNLGGLKLATNVITGNRRIFDAENKSVTSIAGVPSTEIIGSSFNGLTINNMGVPGAKSFHLTLSATSTPPVLFADANGIPGETANPYFVRFATSSTTSVIADAAIQAPTFFTLWIGNNDVLSYATSGGVGSTAGIASNDITPSSVFDPTYDALVGALTTNPSTKGLLINIPDVSTIPHFTTVPYNPLPLDQGTADLLNGAYAAYNTGVDNALTATLINSDEASRRKINFTAGQNAVVISTDSTDLTTIPGLPFYRHATSNDLIVLTAGSKINTANTATTPATLWGLTSPLEDGDVLIPSEIAAINTARLAFNAKIKNVADNNPNLAFYDVAAFMAKLKTNGINYGTGTITSTFVSGGGFSLDGVHPTARGYSVVANGMLDTINATFGANIPKVDPGTYTTIFLK